MLVQAGKFSGCFAPEASRKNCFGLRLQFGSLLVESRDGIRKSAFPCFRCALLQLCSHRSNLRESSKLSFMPSTEPLCISNCLRRSQAES